jgi:quercetin dioxygenase-like cupin family protein
VILRDWRSAAPEAVSHDPSIEKRVMLQGGDVPGVTAFSVARFSPGQETRAHRHASMTEVFLVLDGAGVAEVEGAPVRVQAGSCLVVEAGELHALRNAGEHDLVVAYFGVATGGAAEHGSR